MDDLISAVHMILSLWCIATFSYTYRRWAETIFLPKGEVHITHKDEKLGCDWEGTFETPYRPWHNGSHHITMGLKQTTLEDWDEIDKTYLDRYHYKRQLFADGR